MGDPDLVEANLEFVRRWKGPRLLKLAFVAMMAGIWKWAYYAPGMLPIDVVFGGLQACADAAVTGQVGGSA